MDPRDFLKTAAHLKDQEGEHHTRSSMSRSYYAVHLHIRNFISKTFLGERFFKNDLHQNVINCLQQCEVRDIKEIGFKLDILRQARTDADYKMNKNINPNKGHDTYDAADELLSDFEDKLEISENRQKFAASSQLQARLQGILPS